MNCTYVILLDIEQYFVDDIVCTYQSDIVLVEDRVGDFKAMCNKVFPLSISSCGNL